jgi:transitional endoplasmic reticulum ATPase
MNLLSPAQSATLRDLRRALAARPIAYLKGTSGRGMSTVLSALAEETKGKYLAASDYAPAISQSHPLAFDDQTFQVISEAIENHPCVIADDVHLVLQPAMNHFAPRLGLVNIPLLALCDKAEALGHKLVIGAACCLPAFFEQRGFGFGIPKFTIEDYRFLLGRWLPADKAEGLDIKRIHRFAPKLDAHHLRAVAQWWMHHADPHTTDSFIEVMKAHRLGSNVDLGEVQDVRLEDLVGVEDAVQTLLRSIVLPHEEEALAQELGLRAKRGVLLYGPPGTGKTTVGRALAHRLRGKFFLIDGTFIAGTDQFYGKVHQVFEAAKENAPSIIFIDDADAIFENRAERGLYRYLLTMIDGLESESNAQITVMMTAMNLGDLPTALVRSGRVELWLEMRLPDDAARRILLDRESATLPDVLRGTVGEAVIAATAGLTGADLKACVTDAKSLYAFDVKDRKPSRTLDEYLLEAAGFIRSNKEKHAAALAMAQLKPAEFGSEAISYAMNAMMPPQDVDEE